MIEAFGVESFMRGTMPNPPVSVMLIDGHQMFNEGLVALLSPIPTLSIVGVFASGKAGLQAYKEQCADIVIIGDEFEDMHMITLVQELRLFDSQVRILVLASRLHDFTILETIRSGASGYVSKTNSFHLLEKALLKISQGQTFYCDRVSQVLARHVLGDHDASNIRSQFNRLTQREREIMIALLGGIAIQDIALTLGISRKTVTSHKSKIFEKLGAKNMVEFVRIGTELGF